MREDSPLLGFPLMKTSFLLSSRPILTKYSLFSLPDFLF